METLRPDAWNRTREIFERALALPCAERRPFVAAVCYAGGGIMIGRTYDVSPDGRRFLMLKVDSSAQTSLVVVQGWLSELTRLAAAN